MNLLSRLTLLALTLLITGRFAHSHQEEPLDVNDFIVAMKQCVPVLVNDLCRQIFSEENCKNLTHRREKTKSMYQLNSKSGYLIGDQGISYLPPSGKFTNKKMNIKLESHREKDFDASYTPSKSVFTFYKLSGFLPEGHGKSFKLQGKGLPTFFFDLDKVQGIDVVKEPRLSERREEIKLKSYPSGNETKYFLTGSYYGCLKNQLKLDRTSSEPFNRSDKRHCIVQ